MSAEETPHGYFYRWDQALRLLERADKLIICAIQGFAVGGGLQLPLACDIHILTKDTILGLPASKEGFNPGLGTYRLPRYIGPDPAAHGNLRRQYRWNRRAAYRAGGLRRKAGGIRPRG
ncbi:MAG: hypothetical protein CL696_12030 [Chloroflexi bacterium]|nr:hypothetical protein [Chloroflexota bacterium]MQG56154.1 enoyl-CoA hydratase/isomerase family protein [SAR202 cluster bacterium]